MQGTCSYDEGQATEVGDRGGRLAIAEPEKGLSLSQDERRGAAYRA